MSGTRNIVLVGASVGRAWDVERLPARTGLSGFRLTYAGKYDFDKSDVLETLLAGPDPRPDGILLKECAAYFPGEFGQMQELMTRWIDRCRAEGVRPIPCTVVPVTVPDRRWPRLASAAGRLRGKIPSRVRLAAILEFNDWLTGIASRSDLVCLDLEKAVRCDDRDRRLREDLHSGDGLHLNRSAYALLDRAAATALVAAFPGAETRGAS